MSVPLSKEWVNANSTWKPGNPCIPSALRHLIFAPPPCRGYNLGMSEERKKPTAGFWITVALVAALVGYPLSFGPACWVTTISASEPGVRYHKSMIVYWPLGAVTKGDGLIARTLQWWMKFGTRDGQLAVVPTNSNGAHVVGYGSGATMSGSLPRE